MDADPRNTADAYMKRYGERIYNPSANAQAIAEKNAAIARRVRFDELFRPKVVDLD